MSSTTKSYFECKMRDLNNKLNNEEDRKKQERTAWIYC